MRYTRPTPSPPTPPSPPSPPSSEWAIKISIPKGTSQRDCVSSKNFLTLPYTIHREFAVYYGLPDALNLSSEEICDALCTKNNWIPSLKGQAKYVAPDGKGCVVTNDTVDLISWRAEIVERKERDKTFRFPSPEDTYEAVQQPEDPTNPGETEPTSSGSVRFHDVQSGASAHNVEGGDEESDETDGPGPLPTYNRRPPPLSFVYPPQGRTWLDEEGNTLLQILPENWFMYMLDELEANHEFLRAGVMEAHHLSREAKADVLDLAAEIDREQKYQARILTRIKDISGWKISDRINRDITYALEYGVLPEDNENEDSDSDSDVSTEEECEVPVSESSASQEIDPQSPSSDLKKTEIPTSKSNYETSTQSRSSPSQFQQGSSHSPLPQKKDENVPTVQTAPRKPTIKILGTPPFPLSFQNGYCPTTQTRSLSPQKGENTSLPAQGPSSPREPTFKRPMTPPHVKLATSDLSEGQVHSRPVNKVFSDSYRRLATPPRAGGGHVAPRRVNELASPPPPSPSLPVSFANLAEAAGRRNSSIIMNGHSLSSRHSTSTLTLKRSREEAEMDSTQLTNTEIKTAPGPVSPIFPESKRARFDDSATIASPSIPNPNPQTRRPCLKRPREEEVEGKPETSATGSNSTPTWVIRPRKKLRWEDVYGLSNNDRRRGDSSSSTIIDLTGEDDPDSETDSECMEGGEDCEDSEDREEKEEEIPSFWSRLVGIFS